MKHAVYMDYNATAPLRPAVGDAMNEALAITGNPSSVHRFGRLARRVIEEARRQVASLVGAEANEVIFTSGGTEANNLALGSFDGAGIVVSAAEHDSVLGAARMATIAPVDGHGVLDLEALERILQENPPQENLNSPPAALVSVMLANNETGVIGPVAAAAEIAHANGALLHCDAVQAPGRIAIDMASLGADLLTLSAHKMGGPQGAGALVARGGVTVVPAQLGGGQERGFRAGTENVAAIAGFGAACDLARRDIADQAHLAAWRDDLEARIGACAPAAKVFGAGAERLGNTSCFTMPGVASETQVMALDLAGVAVSAGAACSSGKVGVSHVLKAMGATEAEASSAIRVSLGWRSRAGDIDQLIEAWRALHARAGAAAVAAAPAA
ncbi:MAG: cysteine desulfurase [Proteobacteria bacterium]|nr:cysteine desulfurase [Pseudomonadota bacterium]